MYQIYNKEYMKKLAPVSVIAIAAFMIAAATILPAHENSTTY